VNYFNRTFLLDIKHFKNRLKFFTETFLCNYLIAYTGSFLISFPPPAFLLFATGAPANSLLWIVSHLQAQGVCEVVAVVL
jgi:hypothetical protein